MGLYRCLKPVLMRSEPEWSHRATIALCATLERSGLLNAIGLSFGAPDPILRTDVAGIGFPSPVGLAAGFDKNAQAVEVMSRLGFGFIEVGSVSERPSVGNRQRPRLWRLERDEALRVYYGCPSDGAAAVAKRLRRRRIAVPLGVNLVETNTASVASAEHAAQELARTMGQFSALADYLVLNLSCPNMPQGCGLFDDPKLLAMLLACCSRHPHLPPVFLKITPPDDPEDPHIIDAILTAVEPFAFVKGFILNIPNRNPYVTLRTPRAELDRMRGGITGPSLRAPSNVAIAAWYERIDRSRHVLIGVGGIASAEDAYETILLGASLVQLYTALVYRGPGLIKQINKGLQHLIERDGARSIAEVVGVGVRDHAARKKADTTRLVEETLR
jgi:dihydroorotate dehydrogenase (fumarate)/dihydroorotate dehydrogenase